MVFLKHGIKRRQFLRLFIKLFTVNHLSKSRNMQTSFQSSHELEWTKTHHKPSVCSLLLSMLHANFICYKLTNEKGQETNSTLLFTKSRFSSKPLKCVINSKWPQNPIFLNRIMILNRHVNLDYMTEIHFTNILFQ